MSQVLHEIQEAWPVLLADERLDRFRALSPADAEEFFPTLSSRAQADIVLGLPPGERRLWLRLLPPDDLADLVQEAPEEERANLVAELTEPVRREVRALLAYAEDDAGGLMSPRFARLRPDMPTEDALRYLRRQVAGQLETIYYAYVLDGEQRLLGVVSMRDLLAASGEKTVREIMSGGVVSVPQDMDQEGVARLIAKHDLLAVPVVDEQGRMKGIVTVDDIVDVVQHEATEDIHKLGGLDALDRPYLQMAFFPLVRRRAGWLAVLFLGELLTASAMAYYETELARAVVLTLFLPLIISSGGNAGSQATTLIIRAMALGEVRLKDWFRIVRRELRMGLALGLILACIGLARVLVWQGLFHSYGEYYVRIAFAVAVSLVGVVTWGTLSGSMLPFVLRRFHLDPASASAPFVATLVDVSGLVIYFSVAEVLLRGALL